MTTTELALAIAGMLAALLAAASACFHRTGHDHGMCADCRQHPATTEWAGNGRQICRVCCEARQDAYAADQMERLVRGQAS